MHTQVQQHTEEGATPLTIKVKVNLFKSTERKFNPVSSNFKILILRNENHTFLLRVSPENFTFNQEDTTFVDDFINTRLLLDVFNIEKKNYILIALLGT